jgi:hypothetical protein
MRTGRESKLFRSITKLWSGESKLLSSVTKLWGGESKLLSSITKLWSGESKLLSPITKLWSSESKLLSSVPKLCGRETKFQPRSRSPLCSECRSSRSTYRHGATRRLWDGARFSAFFAAGACTEPVEVTALPLRGLHRAGTDLESTPILLTISYLPTGCYANFGHGSGHLKVITRPTYQSPPPA